MQHLVGGISSAGRALPALDGQPFVVERASGPHIWGKDGRRYIDTALGFGAILLGHADPVVNEAVHKVVERGSMPAFAHDGEEEAAAAIAAACGPLSSVLFTNSGSEAVHMACRIARAVTGRRTIVKMAAGFDGWFDPVAFGNAGSPEALIGNGPRPERSDVALLRFNDLADAERLFAERSDIAAVIVEPLLANAGCIEAAPGYLARLGELARRNGALLIADEVLTGFRLRFGLASHALGFEPDIATLGKAIGNGFAVAAVAGRPDILAAAADGRAVRAGTYSGNPVATAAVSASLGQLRASDYAALEARGQRVRGTLAEAFARRGVAVRTSGFGPVFTLWFGQAPPAAYEDAAAAANPARTLSLHTALRRQSVMTMPQAFGRFYLSFAHSDAVVAAMEEAVTAAVASLPQA
ncbi:aminotransferase class III-fold pyridoxal phosphate-dependent enzyme [Aureimonas flava]|uniref:Aminotransferase class III-fold pyridoxal phosphate-dependent enzyme n=1 Tax=Aureimonas flava TaxID=2320271 RepID=A0A3A1WT47_9HYPH|nr:aminotransferase class III-fold pyridoxal phosphate-dependent enzyme [Aureimonas flava]RIY01424.1 aminotransferase class III-fold pyridoxal phosphate-dependent enzyme [Aureimonas flava]